MSNVSFIRFYLFLFNVISASAWGFVGFLTILNLSRNEFWDLRSFWNMIEFPVRFAQTIAIVEIFHCLLGFVPSPIMMNVVQIFSRLQIVWVIWGFVPESQTLIWTLGCVVAWSSAELLRYPFYAVNNMNISTPYVMKWLRYSGFLVLYPLGILSEVMCIIHSLPILKNDVDLRSFPYAMPNRYNFQMDLFVVYCVLLVLYIPGTFLLYGYMWKTRGKKLSSSEENKTKIK